MNVTYTHIIRFFKRINGIQILKIDNSINRNEKIYIMNSIYIYIYICAGVCVFVYIYIYREREKRETERQRDRDRERRTILRGREMHKLGWKI